MWRPYDDKARAADIAERRLAEHQAYLKQEEERRARQEEMQRQIAIAEAAQGAKEYADRQAAASMGLSQLPQYTMGQAQTALYDQMAQQAQAEAAQQNAQAQREKIVARLKELDSARSKRISDPNFKMAAMLAMAGQPGAMQSLLTLDAQARANGTASKAQTDMDALEDKMVNDIFALSGANPDQFDKITKALIPLYQSKFEEAQQRGGKSRLGGWDAWEEAISGAVASNQNKKSRAAMLKEYNELSGKKNPTEADKARLKQLARLLNKK